MTKMRETVATLRKMIEGGETNPKVSGKSRFTWRVCRGRWCGWRARSPTA